MEKKKEAKMSSLPEEMYHEILARLKVKSLQVCKCVCKTWYALITSSDFIKTQITVQEKNPILMLGNTIWNNDNYVHDFDSGNSSLLYCIDYDSLASSVCQIKDDATELNYPYKSSNSEVHLLGSCNGLICMWVVIHCAGYQNFFHLWNPATREYKKIPVPRNVYKLDGVFIHAFGYDHKTDCYKLAIGTVKQNGISKSEILYRIYSSSSNSWKTWNTKPYRFPFGPKSGVLVNGDLHWLGIAQEGPVLLLSLDIGDERFKEMQLPKDILEMKHGCMTLGVLEKHLCVLVCPIVDGLKVPYEVWEMMNYGVRESWIKRCVIAPESIITYQGYFRLLCSFKNGKILLLGFDNLVLYDPKQGCATKLKIDNCPSLNAVNYFESLVPLNSGRVVGNSNWW